MAIKAKDEHVCKLVHNENGRMTIRRIKQMMVQSAQGKVFWLRGTDLPDSITLCTGEVYHGEPLAQILLRPKNAIGIPVVFQSGRWPSYRDVFHFLLGLTTGVSLCLWLVHQMYNQLN